MYLTVFAFAIVAVFLGLRYFLRLSWARHIITAAILAGLLFMSTFIITVYARIDEDQKIVFISVVAGVFMCCIGTVLLLYSDAYRADMQPDNFRIHKGPESK